MTADLIRGDCGYDELLAQSAPWRSFHDYVHSQSFVDRLLGTFENYCQSSACLLELHQAEFVDYTEGRTPIHRKSIEERSRFGDLGPNAVFTRMDLGVGDVGYQRAAHVDWRHRIASVLIYFDDADEQRMAGGDLHILKAVDLGEFEKVVSVRPTKNLGLAKLDSNESFHSVDPIIKTDGLRRTLYIAISGYRSVWPRHDAPSS